jgi:serine phosphatase RsbU (regulator of sigma subunit)
LHARTTEFAGAVSGLEKPRFLESKLLSRSLTVFGFFLLLITLLQLPLSVFFQNTRPAIPFRIVKVTTEGLLVAPSALAQLAKRSAIRERDIITALDGVPVDSASLTMTTLSDLFGTARLNDTLHAELLRDGQRMTVDLVLLQTRGEAHGAIMSFTLYIVDSVAPLVILLIALVVLLRRTGNREAALYFLLSASMAVYLLTSSPLSMYIPWWSAWRVGTLLVSTTGIVLFFPFLLHFLLVFPEERRIRGSARLRNGIVYTPFLALLGFVFVQEFVLQVRESTWVSLVVNYGFIAPSPFIGAAILLSSYRRARSAITRKVIKTLMIGILLFGLSFAIIITLSFYGTEWQVPGAVILYATIAAWAVGTVALPLSFGYAILRYGFLDVRVIFKRTTVYAILAAFVALFFIAIYLLLQEFIDIFNRTELLFVSVIVTGVLAVAVTMLKDRIQHFVDARLFREEFRVATELRNLSRAMVNMLNRDELLEALARRLPATLGLRGASVLGLDEHGEAAHLAGDRIDADPLRALTAHAQFRRTMADGDVLVLNRLPGFSPRPDMNAAFPVAAHDGETVTALLGERRDGKPLSSEVLELLRTVADHAALGWKNARLTEEMKEQERIKKEIEIAHSIQAAMLPLRTPDIPGIEIAAVSTPARDVGGDFFDFVRTADGKTGIVIGDVADKGVSAAMVMASSISTLRYAAELDTSPSRILGRTNSRLFVDTHKHMFVAVFFGVLDLESRALVFTNAGLPKPLLQRGGESFLLEWSDNGHHYPLGTQPQVEFHEQSLPLEEGDILVLYTDGVVESSNVHDEEYGVKRLRDVVRLSSHLSAEDMKRRIVDDVAAFSGRKELFDDLTLVIIKFWERA